jgi:uncharacterized protein with von Willebrand factor type A (vWA) domain
MTLLSMAAVFLAAGTVAQTPPPALRIVLLVDTSDSMTSRNPFRRGDRTLLTDAAVALATALRPDEAVSVDTFGPAINVSQAMLRREEIVPAADALNDRTGGASPLWDALDAAVHSLDGVTTRRAIVVVTDGRTTGNNLSFAEIRLRLQQARVPVFFICAERPKQARIADPSVRLREIATATGGQYYVIRNYSGLTRPRPEEIRRVMRHALEAIRKNVT